jgi:hypothetical protein
MDKLYEEVLKMIPAWIYVIAGIIILIGLIGAVFFIWLGVKRFADGMNKESRLIALQSDLITEKETSKRNSGIASQLLTATENAEAFLRNLNEISESSDYEANARDARFLIQRVVDALASDIKHRPGERHRCGVWSYIDDRECLELMVASSGFPNYYIGERRLDIHRSIAGRSFRKKQVEKIDNVNEDMDWEKNSQSHSAYTAMICIPINDLGVFTIDALHPMSEEVACIGQLYARVIEGAFIAHYFAFRIIQQTAEAAAASGNE